MNRRLTFNPAAERELLEASEYYGRENATRAKEFLDEVQRSTLVLMEYPLASQAIRGQLRRKLLLRFPYAISYSIKSTEIRTLAIAHLKRRPFYCAGRR